MNNNINPQLPKFNTGSTRNQRDTVYKLGPNSTFTFYQLYDDIMLILKPISTYSNDLVVSREFDKVASKSLTIITLFFIPALNRLLSQERYKLLCEGFLENLTTIMKGFDLEGKATVSVAQTPAPNDEDMTRYVNEFVGLMLKICPDGTDTNDTSTKTVKFKKPHMLGLKIDAKEEKEQIQDKIKALYKMTLRPIPLPYRGHTLNGSIEMDASLSLF